MMTVHQVSRLTGVSIRTLQYYDEIGLLPPARVTEAKYRLYDEEALERLQQILLFRELEFPLKQIREILDRPDFDRKKALDQQRSLLELKKERLESLIALTKKLQATGGNNMEFTAFDKTKQEEYAARAKAEWGGTEAWREYAQKSKGRTDARNQTIAAGLMEIFTEFAAVKQLPPASGEAQALVRKLQDYITRHYYRCTDTILAGLGRGYGCGGEFTENINKAAGDGTAEYAAKAIRIYCENGRSE